MVPSVSVLLRQAGTGASVSAVAVGGVAAVPTPSVSTGEVLPGWLRTASNTGLAAAGVSVGDLTAYTGSMSPSNTTITLKDIDGALSVGANVTLDRCRIVTGAEDAVVITGDNVTMVNCDVVGPRSSTVNCFGIKYENGTGMSLTSVKVTGYAVGMYIGAGGTVDQCYVYEMPLNSGTAVHRDCFTRRNGTNQQTITNSRFEDLRSDGGTATVFFQNTWGVGVSNSSFSRCYFYGSTFCAALETSSNLTFDDNRLTAVGGYWAVTSVTNLVRTNNYVYANDPGNDYRGTAVNS